MQATEELEQLGIRRIPVHTKVISAKAKCGHKVVANWPPTNHCDDCWITYFSAHPSTVHENFQHLINGREDEIKRSFGAKYLKHFKRFVQYTQEIDRQKEEQERAVA